MFELPMGYKKVSSTAAEDEYGNRLVMTCRGWSEELADPVSTAAKREGLHKKKGPTRQVGAQVEMLIRKGTMTDNEIVEAVQKKFPGASTSVKCVQWYRCKMRKNGELPPLPKRRIRTLSELTFEVTEPNTGDIKTLTVKEMIKYASNLMIQDGAEKKIVRECIYSAGTAAAYLKTQCYEVLEQSLVEQTA